MIALGFGVIETAEQDKIKKAALRAAMKGTSIDDALKEWNQKGDVYDKMPRGEAPERYTKVWVYGGAFHFHHINRNHPFSPDGWGLLHITEIFDEEEHRKFEELSK